MDGAFERRHAELLRGGYAVVRSGRVGSSGAHQPGSRGLPCRGYSGHTYKPRGPHGRFECGCSGRDRAIVKKGIINKASSSAALHKKLLVDARDILLEKPRFGAFQGTDLELILRSRGIDAVIITGIATNVCCETTAREAAVRDFRVFFLSDGTATFDIGTISAAELQRATCATLGLLFAQVLTVDNMIEKIPNGQRC